MAPPPWAVRRRAGVAVNGAQEFVSDFGEVSDDMFNFCHIQYQVRHTLSHEVSIGHLPVQILLGLDGCRKCGSQGV
jgi:hypothetical protein